MLSSKILGVLTKYKLLLYLATDLQSIIIDISYLGRLTIDISQALLLEVRNRSYLYLLSVGLYSIFPLYLVELTIFEKHGIELKMCVLCIYKFCKKHFSF